MSGWGIFGLTVSLGIALGSFIYHMVNNNRLTPHKHDEPTRRPSDTPNGHSRKKQITEDSKEKNKTEQNEKMNCTMCHRPLRGRPVQTLECGHKFHEYCINENWFKIVKNNSCPTCRRKR